MTFTELLDAYLASLKPKASYQTYCYVVKQFFGSWTAHPTFAQLDEWHRSLSRTPQYANKGLSFLKAMYFWGMRRGLHSGPNPAVGIRQYKTFSRERVMTSAEVAALLRLCPTLSPKLHAVLVVLLTTGCRIGEALRMEPSHVNVDTGSWVQPRTKNQRVHVTYLPTQARLALARLPRGSRYIFEGRDADSRYSTDAAEEAWQKTRARLHLDDVRLHDFRRTFATHLYEATENDRLVKRCLNHTTKDVTAIYVRISNEAVAQALQAQADRFFALVPPPHDIAVVAPAVPPVVMPAPDPDIRRPLRPVSSKREQQVLMLLAQGHTMTTIAQGLGLSSKTVGTYRRRLMGKLKLTTTNQLIRYAIEQETDRSGPVSAQSIPRPIIAPPVMVPVMPAPMPIAYRAQSVEREEWPG